jgi:hypothetical protein
VNFARIAFWCLIVIYFGGMLAIRVWAMRQLAASKGPRMIVCGWFSKLMCSLFYYEDITKTVDGAESLYLRRWFLWGWSPASNDPRPRRGIYLHHICRSDDDRDPHCHPWDFTTVVLRGGYVDEQWSAWGTGRAVFGLEPCGPGAIRRRRAEHLHRVQLMPGRSSWSLVLTGPKRRSWGFMTLDGWKGWRDYLNAGDLSLEEKQP